MWNTKRSSSEILSEDLLRHLYLKIAHINSLGKFTPIEPIPEDTMSSDVTAGMTPDVYGQVHPVETDEMVAQKLAAFEEELQKLPEDAKKSLKQAEEKCPELINKEFKLMFLRAEVFNADVSYLFCWRNTFWYLDLPWHGIFYGVESVETPLTRVALCFFIFNHSSQQSAMRIIGTNALKCADSIEPFFRSL